MEILWTVVPLVILVLMAIPATKTLIEIYDNTESELDIQITGYQWKWHYKYLGQDVEFFSNLATPQSQIHNETTKDANYLLEVDQPLVIPVGTKVRFLVTAADVIHSWWVPALAVKKDAIPGFVNESWTRIDEPGIFRGQCTELCGKDHGFMPVVVEAKSKEDFAKWLAERKQAALAEKELTSDLRRATDREDRWDAWDEWETEVVDADKDYVKEMRKKGYRSGRVTVGG